MSSKYCSKIFSLKSLSLGNTSGNPPKCIYSSKFIKIDLFVSRSKIPFWRFDSLMSKFLNIMNSLKLRGNISKVRFLPVNNVEYSFFNRYEHEPEIINLSFVFKSYFFLFYESHQEICMLYFFDLIFPYKYYKYLLNYL